MKRFFMMFAIFTLMISSACSVVDEVNKSVNYVDESTSYLTSVRDFAEQAPDLIQTAVTDETSRDELEKQLHSLRQQMEEFNNLEAPTIAEDVHQDIVTQNEAALVKIDQLYKDGELVVEELQNSEIVQMLEDISSLMDTVQNLEL
ncbi:DUF6376 family protein [Metabacillus halosaccharovorans]|uniref:DUF6376 family protein n=1 Tax=Metabacillus halosaccharovorans TaxID=930124 RepID=UPI00203ED7FA|nr:DUF6376 family protein [Metabacillus halosaccharovorans]MCM3442305.1 DUF6376 family protein [Metabacillus halosaccharovorans]